MGFGLFLIDHIPVNEADGREVNINKLDARKRISLSRIDKIFKVRYLQWYLQRVRLKSKLFQLPYLSSFINITEKNLYKSSAI